MSDRQSHTNSHTSEVGEKKRLARLPADAVARVERSIEEHFRQWATDLVSNDRWFRYYENLNRQEPLHRNLKSRREQLLRIVWEFAGDYASLLAKAAVEYARELGTLLDRLSIRLSGVDQQEILSAVLRFPDRFTCGRYDRPWGSFFMMPDADSGDMGDRRTLRVDFQRGNSLARLFGEAEDVTTPRAVAHVFSKETKKWRTRAADRAKDEFRLATARVIGDQLSKTKRAYDLTVRERKILAVIQQGSKGLAYCRELENAHVRTRRTGSWIDCPRTYPAAYQYGKPWRHRIQDEKSKIRRKAIARELAGE